MTTEKTWQIGAFRFSPGTHLLSGPTGDDVLEPKASALLSFFIKNRGRDISRDELIETVWSGQIVSDGAINRVIVRLRRALGDDEKPWQFIVTVPKVGYRFVAPVSEDTEGAAPKPQTIEQDERRSLPIWLVGALVLVLVAVVFALRPAPLPKQSPPTYAPVVRLSSLQFDGVMAPDGEQFVYSQ